MKEEIIFDYSKFNEFFNWTTKPEDVLRALEEMRLEYLELSLYAAEGFELTDTNINEGRSWAHKDIHNHIFQLGNIIDLLKSLTL